MRVLGLQACSGWAWRPERRHGCGRIGL